MPRFLPARIHNAFTSAPLEALVMRSVFTPYQENQRAQPTSALMRTPHGLSSTPKHASTHEACHALDAFFDTNPIALGILIDRWMRAHRYHDALSVDEEVLIICMPEGIGMLHPKATCVMRDLHQDLAPYWDDPATHAACWDAAYDRCDYPPFGLALLPGAASAHAALANHVQERSFWERWNAVVAHHVQAPFPFSLYSQKV